MKMTLKRGNNGDQVVVLQHLLNVEGYKLTIDGDFGAKTEAAVKAFQKAKGLTADGIVGPKTWAALGVKGNVGTKPTKDIHIIMNYGHAKSTPGKRSPLYSTLSKEEQTYFATATMNICQTV